jgi:hypothetical protein
MSPETLVILDHYLNVLETWKSSKHPLVEINQLKLRKYKSFVKFDKEKIKNILLKTFQPT